MPLFAFYPVVGSRLALLHDRPGPVNTGVLKTPSSYPCAPQMVPGLGSSLTDLDLSATLINARGVATLGAALPRLRRLRLNKCPGGSATTRACDPSRFFPDCAACTPQRGVGHPPGHPLYLYTTHFCTPPPPLGLDDEGLSWLSSPSCLAHLRTPASGPCIPYPTRSLRTPAPPGLDDEGLCVLLSCLRDLHTPYLGGSRF